MFRNFAGAALLFVVALSSASASPMYITITGNWGAITTGPGLSTTPFDIGSAFSFTTTVTSLTPTFDNSGETQLPTAGGSYTNGSTVSLAGLEQLVLTDPTVWNGQDFGFGVHDVYFTGDFLELDFNGPELFTPPTSAPTLDTGTYSVEESWYGFSARYYNGTGYSTVVLDSDATLTIEPVPEPSSILLTLLAAPVVILGRRSRRK